MKESKTEQSHADQIWTGTYNTTQKCYILDPDFHSLEKTASVI
jgi:hypothetical protein